MESFAHLLNLVRALFAKSEPVAIAAARETLATAAPGSTEALMAEVTILRYQTEAAKQPQVKTLKVSGIKVSEKGGINVFGLRRFPVNLYPAELLAILTAIEDGTFTKFISENRDKLSLAKAAE